MSNSLELTVVMPCLNEEETLETCIKKVHKCLENEDISYEIVIGDNGSTDGSQDIARKNGARVVDIPIRGYGAALNGAILDAKGKYIIMGDSDDSYDFLGLIPFIKKLREGNDLVMGNRFLGGIEDGAMPFLHKYLGNPVLSLIGRVFFSIPVGDFHCGLRGFSKEAFDKMDLRTTGMEFASEIVVKSSLMGLKITEVPTTLSKDGRSRPPHLNTWTDGWRHLRFLLMYCPRWLFMIPGLFFLSLGIFFSLLISFRSVGFGNVIFGPNTILYSGGMILIGFEICCFYVLTKVYAVRKGLLPRSKRLVRFLNLFNLERGLILGVILLIIGIVLTFVSFSMWKDVGYGELNSPVVIRMVIFSVIAFSIGVQTILYSFFLSIMRID